MEKKKRRKRKKKRTNIEKMKIQMKRGVMFEYSKIQEISAYSIFICNV